MHHAGCKIGRILQTNNTGYTCYHGLRLPWRQLSQLHGAARSHVLYMLQMRGLMYVATLTSEIMNAVAALEAAWEEAAAHQTTAWPFPQLSLHASRYEQ
jgi:uncharacterized pyridoxal phosphate-containing UPF0001 family protein